MQSQEWTAMAARELRGAGVEILNISAGRGRAVLGVRERGPVDLSLILLPYRGNTVKAVR